MRNILFGCWVLLVFALSVRAQATPIPSQTQTPLGPRYRRRPRSRR
jgi:hypothetical protein